MSANARPAQADVDPLASQFRGRLIAQCTDVIAAVDFTREQSLVHLYPIDGAVRRVVPTPPPGAHVMRPGRW